MAAESEIGKVLDCVFEGDEEMSRVCFSFQSMSLTNIFDRIDLAYQELYLLLAGIFRKYDSVESGQKGHILALYDTIRERDIDMVADFVVPITRNGTRGVKIIAT